MVEPTQTRLGQLLAAAGRADAEEIVMQSDQVPFASSAQGTMAIGELVSSTALFDILGEVLSDDQQVDLAVGNIVEFTVRVGALDWRLVTEPGVEGVILRGRVTRPRAEGSSRGRSVQIPAVPSASSSQMARVDGPPPADPLDDDFDIALEAPPVAHDPFADAAFGLPEDDDESWAAAPEGGVLPDPDDRGDGGDAGLEAPALDLLAGPELAASALHEDADDPFAGPGTDPFRDPFHDLADLGLEAERADPPDPVGASWTDPAPAGAPFDAPMRGGVAADEGPLDVDFGFRPAEARAPALAPPDPVPRVTPEGAGADLELGAASSGDVEAGVEPGADFAFVDGPTESRGPPAPNEPPGEAQGGTALPRRRPSSGATVRISAAEAANEMARHLAEPSSTRELPRRSGGAELPGSSATSSASSASSAGRGEPRWATTLESAPDDVDAVAAAIPEGSLVHVMGGGALEIVGRRPSLCFVDGDLPAAAAGATEGHSAGLWIVLSLDDPAPWLGWALRRLEEGHRVLVESRARTPEGAWRALMGLDAGPRAESWVAAHHQIAAQIHGQGWRLSARVQAAV